MYEYRQSCSLFKITLFSFKIHLMLLKVREYRESHILCEKGHSSLYSTMAEHPYLPGAWEPVKMPCTIIKSIGTNKAFIIKELSCNTSNLHCRVTHPGEQSRFLSLPLRRASWAEYSDQSCSGFTFFFFFLPPDWAHVHPLLSVTPCITFRDFL